MRESTSGFIELEHTADCKLKVWAPDFPQLAEQAAFGMYQMMGLQLFSKPRFNHQISLQAPDLESLLVDFLSELIYEIETRDIGYDVFQIELSEDKLLVNMAGAHIKNQSREVKAVTYHDLAVRETRQGLNVNVVFDI